MTSFGLLCYEISQYIIHPVILTSPSYYLLISTVVNPKDKIYLIRGIILGFNFRFQGHCSFGSSSCSFLSELYSRFSFHTKTVFSYWILCNSQLLTVRGMPHDEPSPLILFFISWWGLFLPYSNLNFIRLNLRLRKWWRKHDFIFCLKHRTTKWFCTYNLL